MSEKYDLNRFIKAQNIVYDIALAEIAYKEYQENPKTYSHDEVIQMLGL